MSRNSSDERVDSRRRQLLALMGAGGTAGLAGCSGVFGNGDGDGNGNGDTPGGGDGNGGGTQTTVDPDEIPMDGSVTLSSAANPSAFDPTTSADATSNSVNSLMYEYLVDPDLEQAYQPSLAEDWEQVDDTTWRFNIRQGVTFHNGKELTATDVELSVRRTIGTVNDGTVSVWYDDSTVVDESTVEFSLSQPHAPFLADIGSIPILPSNVVSETPSEDDHDFTSESIGTGPFILDSFTAEDRVELVRNDEYWYDGDDYPGMAPWESVTIRVVTEQTTQQEALQTGELDMIDNVYPPDVSRLSENGDIGARTIQGLGYDFIAFPVQVEPFTNRKFRRGITRLIPRQDVVDVVFSNYATPISQPISPGLGQYFDEEFNQRLLDESVGQNEEEALQLLEEAFNEMNMEPPYDITLVTNVNRTRERWMEVIQQRLDQTEYFNATLDVRPFDQLVPFLTSGDAGESEDLVGIGWTGGSDPDSHGRTLLSSDYHVPNGFNWIFYENEEVDQLLTEGRTTVEVDQRRQIYQDLSEILAQEVPYAFMWTSDQIDMVRTDSVENWEAYPNSSQRYWGLYRPTIDLLSYEPSEG